MSVAPGESGWRQVHVLPPAEFVGNVAVAGLRVVGVDRASFVESFRLAEDTAGVASAVGAGERADDSRSAEDAPFAIHALGGHRHPLHDATEGSGHWSFSSRDDRSGPTMTGSALVSASACRRAARKPSSASLRRTSVSSRVAAATERWLNMSRAMHFAGVQVITASASRPRVAAIAARSAAVRNGASRNSRSVTVTARERAAGSTMAGSGTQPSRKRWILLSVLVPYPVSSWAWRGTRYRSMFSSPSAVSGNASWMTTTSPSRPAMMAVGSPAATWGTAGRAVSLATV